MVYFEKTFHDANTYLSLKLIHYHTRPLIAQNSITLEWAPVNLFAKCTTFTSQININLGSMDAFCYHLSTSFQEIWCTWHLESKKNGTLLNIYLWHHNNSKPMIYILTGQFQQIMWHKNCYLSNLSPDKRFTVPTTCFFTSLSRIFIMSLSFTNLLVSVWFIAVTIPIILATSYESKG